MCSTLVLLAAVPCFGAETVVEAYRSAGGVFDSPSASGAPLSATLQGDPAPTGFVSQAEAGKIALAKARQVWGPVQPGPVLPACRG